MPDDLYELECEAAEEARKGLPTEYHEGEWHFAKPGNPEPWAVVTFTDEPSPETGHEGWCWWAMGSMGEAPTYEAACAAAVAELERMIDEGGAK